MTLILGAILSAFVNNTPVVVLLLPILIESLGNNSSPSEVLCHGLFYSCGWYGNLVCTSTNLLVVNLSGLGGPMFDMFDFVFPIIAGGMASFICG